MTLEQMREVALQTTKAPPMSMTPKEAAEFWFRCGWEKCAAAQKFLQSQEGQK